MIISHKKLNIHCSKAMLIMYIFSLCPTFAMDNIEEGLDNNNIIKSPTLSDNQFDIEDNVSNINNNSNTSNDKNISNGVSTDNNGDVLEQEVDKDKDKDKGDNISIQEQLDIKNDIIANHSNVVAVDTSINVNSVLNSDTSIIRLNFNGGTKLTEEFSKDKYNYKAIIPSKTSSISWGASFDSSSTTEVNRNKATMSVYWNGELKKENITMLQNFSIPYVNDAENNLTIVVTAENGDKATYTISFCRQKYSDTSLQRLNFYGGIKLTEEFSKDKYIYNATVPSGTNTITWGVSFDSSTTTEVNRNKSTMDIYWNGKLQKENITMLAKGFSIPYVNDADNILTIIVTAENGDKATYTVSFYRTKYSDTSLQRLNFYGGITLTEEFSKDKYQYNAILPSSINTITWGASFDSSTTTEVNRNKATMNVYWNGELKKENITMLSKGFSLELLPKTSNVMEIVVNAENNLQSTYTVTFERELDSNTNIKDVTLNKGSVEVVDDIYTATMDSWQDISLSQLLLEDSWANYKAILNNEKEISVNEDFNLEMGNNKLEIEVTSNNGTKKTYPVVFGRSDNINPTLDITLDTNTWTNNDVLLDVHGSDDSGIRYIELPSGEKVYSSEAKFYAHDNGTYQFKVYDNFLN